MQRTSSITSSSDLKFGNFWRVIWERDDGTSLQCEHFLEVLSLTTLCSCMPFFGVIPRLVFTVWARNYKSQRSNLTDSSKDQAKAFMSQGDNTDDIISAGETALVCLYNGNPHHGINVLRYEKLCVKAATSTVPVHRVALPPPSGLVKYHSLKVYHQIQEWLGVEMCSVDWGWKVSAGKLLPIMTDLQPAPQKFLEVVRCACKCLRYHVLFLQEVWDDLLYCLLQVQGCMW